MCFQIWFAMFTFGGECGHAGTVELEYTEIAEFLMTGPRPLRMVMGCTELPSETDCSRSTQIDVAVVVATVAGGRFRLGQLTPPAFTALGARYAIFPSRPIELLMLARVEDGGLLVEVSGSGAHEFQAVCLGGACTEPALLPHIVWHDPELRVVLAAGAGRSGGTTGGGARTTDAVDAELQVRSLSVSGRIALACREGLGIGAFVCATARSLLQPYLEETMRGALGAWQRRVNTTGLVNLLAQGFGNDPGESRSGSGRYVGITSLSADTKGVRLSFCLGAACQ